MSVFEPKIQKVLVFDPAQARATVASFSETILLKDSQIEALIFLLAEIRNEQHANNQKIIKILQDKLLQEFLRYPAPLTESAFEEVLHSINTIIPTIINDGEESILKDISFVTGVITGDTLHFSQVGPATILFLQNGKISDLSNHQQAQALNPLKLFREITSGKLEDTDILFMSTTNFLDYFSQQKIRRILEEHVAKSVPAGFEEFLIQAPLSTSFSALSLAVEKKKPTSVDEYIDTARIAVDTQEQKKNSSMEELIHREEETENIMSPRLLPYLREKTKKIGLQTKVLFRKYIRRKPTRISPILTERNERSPQEYLYKQRTHLQEKPINTQIFKKTKQVGINILQKISSATSNTLKNLRKKTTSIDMGPAVSYKKTNEGRFQLLKWFSGLALQRKIVVIVIVLVIALFAQSIVFSGIRSEQKLREETKQAQQDAITNAMSEIDAAILYGDDNRIQEAVTSLESQLANLDERTFSDSIQETENAIAEAKQKLQRIREIPEPAELASLSSLVENNPLVSLSFFQGTIFSLDPSQRQIVAVDASSGESRVISLDESIPQYMTESDSSIYIVTQDFQLYQVTSASTSAQQVTFGGSDKTYNLAGIASYLNRLYLINITQNQILVGSRFAGGIGNPTAWLDTPIDMTNASGLAIDGEIYVGFRNGTVRKFLRGVEQSFAIAELQDPINELSQIWTSETNDALYLLDKNLNRLIKVNKNNGSLIEQLIFPSLSEITAFSINEDSGTLFLLSGQSIYTAPLS